MTNKFPQPAFKNPLARIWTLVQGYPGALALVFVYVCLTLTASLGKNVYCDENLHLVAGYSYWLTGDYRIQPENGNLAQRWVALPLFLADVKPFSTSEEIYHSANSHQLSMQWLYSKEIGNDPDRILLLGRCMTALVGAALGLLIYAWSRQLFGPGGGMISLVLFTFSPTLLAFGAIATSDLFAGFFFLATTYAFWNLLQRITPWTLLVSCLAMAGLFLAKFSAPLIVPIGLIMGGVRLWQKQPLLISWWGQRVIQGFGSRLGLILGIAVIHVVFVWVCIWAAYSFRYEIMVHPQPGRAKLFPEWPELLGLDSKPALDFIQWVRRHQVLPEGYIYGFAHTLHFARFRSAFLHGEIRFFGWPWFFPKTFLWKTPLSFLVLMLLALWSLRQIARKSPFEIGHALVPLLALWGVYWLAAILSHLNIGHRHILPTYPPLFVLAGALVYFFRGYTSSPSALEEDGWGEGGRLPQIGKDPLANNLQVINTPSPLAGEGWGGGEQVLTDVSPPPKPSHVKGEGFNYLKIKKKQSGLSAKVITLTLMLYVLEALWVFPNYLAYFNQIVGRPQQGYKYLVDSSLDWGQDLKALKKRLDTQYPEEPTYLLYFGYGSPEYYQIPARDLPWKETSPFLFQQECRGGLFCISATHFQGVYLRPPGHWNKGYEKQYRGLLSLKTSKEKNERIDDPQIQKILSSPTEYQKILHVLNELALARLVSFLRQKQPLDQVNYSILIFRLTDEEVHEAFFGPPREFVSNIGDSYRPPLYQAKE